MFIDVSDIGDVRYTIGSKLYLPFHLRQVELPVPLYICIVMI